MTPVSAADRLHLLDSHTHQLGYRAPSGSEPLVPGYPDSCSSGGDQRALGCGMPGTVGPQAVETW